MTEEFLPPDRPMFAALMRALPAGLLLLAFTRTLPRGEWWWKSAVLGLCNIGLFFPLIFLSAYGLPGGLAVHRAGDLAARRHGARLLPHRRARHACSGSPPRWWGSPA